MRRIFVTAVAVAAALSAVAVAPSGCARPGGAPSPQASGFPARAEQVAAAWRAALAAAGGDAWRHGFVPLQDLTVPPSTGFTGPTKVAYVNGWYVSREALPGGPLRSGTVRFHSGATVPVRLVTAREAFSALRRGDPPCAGGVEDCVRLTVTGVELRTVTLWTSRGDAEVPAWLFHIAELAGPVARVAVRVDPRTLALAAPAVPAPQGPATRDLRQVTGLTGVAGDRLELSIGIGACDRNPAGLVYETPVYERPGEVVVAGTATAATGLCTDQLLMHPVSVRLERPLGDRVVLDAVSGRPLPEGGAMPWGGPMRQPGGR